MKRKTSFKKMALALMAGAMLVGTPYATYAADDDNTCGAEAKWSYNKDKKELTITGKGEITWDSDWSDLKIKSVVVKKGITKIDSYTFSGLYKLKNISLPSTIKVIGDNAFENTAIKTFKISSNIQKMGTSVFSDCDELEEVEWNYKNIPAYTFSSCDNLKTVKIKSKIKSVKNSAFSGSGIVSSSLARPRTASAPAGSADPPAATWHSAHRIVPGLRALLDDRRTS